MAATSNKTVTTTNSIFEKIVRFLSQIFGKKNSSQEVQSEKYFECKELEEQKAKKLFTEQLEKIKRQTYFFH